MGGVANRCGYLISQTRFGNCLYIQRVIPGRQRVAAHIRRVQSRGEIVQRHKVLPVKADVRRIVIDRVLLTAYAPIQRIPRNGR